MSALKGLGDWAAKLHPRGAGSRGSKEGFLGIALLHICKQAGMLFSLFENAHLLKADMVVVGRNG